MSLDMTSKPTGIVTFLFTDVEGSTRLWEQHPAEMTAVLSRHDTVVREAAEKFGGYTVKNTGDGFLFAFSSARKAAEAAVCAQQILKDQEWDVIGTLRVRMALHSGETEERDNDYFGTTVNRAARLLSAAHGGQVLASSVARQLMHDDPPDEISFRYLGQHRLNDLTRADHIFQILAPGLPDNFPALRTLDFRPNNLPVQSTSFLGRQKDLGDIEVLLERARLVTLIGTGGVGKTRLALEVAGRVLGRFPDGVWFIDLAPLTNPDLVSQTVSSVLSVQERQGESTETTLLESLRHKEILLILDNCEHVIEACARLCDGLLKTCPKVQILATSREPLRITGETRWQVPTLSVPRDQSGRFPDRLEAFDSVQLFLDRASAIKPGLSLTPENSYWIAAIVRQLDGIPLAIELAAARVNVLSIEQLASRLADRFALLRTGNREALPRQQTLEALISWSYELLTSQEQALFQRLSVFAGSFTIEAVEKVGAGNGIETGDILGLLSQLVEKSLVIVEEDTVAYRYRMLESLRAYARRQLQLNDDEDRYQRQHAQFFLSLAEQAKPNLSSEDLKLLRSESDNFRVVLEWSRTHDLETGLRLATALWQVWWLGSQVSEGRFQMERLWDRPLHQVGLDIQMDALHARGYLAFRDNDFIAARSYFEEMRLLAEEDGDARRILMAVRALGGMLVEQMDYEAAAVLLRESMRIEAELADAPSSPLARVDLGLIELVRGDFAESERLFQESLDMAERDNDQWRIAMAHASLGLVAVAQDSTSAARAHLDLSLKLSWEEHIHWVIPIILEGFACLAVQQNELHQAVRLVAAATRFREEAEIQSAPLWQQLLSAPLEKARMELDASIWDTLWDEGKEMSIEQAVKYALKGGA
jgi:predicted ATPase/class 3 adenylate cyclase